MKKYFKLFVKRYEIGTGKVSGIVSIFFACLALGGVLCFKFPEQLTTKEFREIYTPQSMNTLITIVIILSLLFGLLNVLLSKKRRNGMIGILLASFSIVLGGFSLSGRAIEKTSWNIGLDWLLLDLFLMAVIFIPIEMVLPKRTNQDRFHEEWRTDLIYFAISHLFIQFFSVVSQKPAVLFFGNLNLQPFQQWIQDLPFLIELFLAFFITDLFQYWTHRFFHSHVFLWRFHAVHHSTKAMDWLAGSRTHFIDIFVTRTATFIPLYVCGFSNIVFSLFVIIIAIHAVFIHANTRINLGFLKYIITTPQYHHWHHCIDDEHYGKNFAVFFPFIDRIFGTYYLPNNTWPSGTGLNEAKFPKGYIKQLIYPFNSNPFESEINEKDVSKR